MVSRSTSQNIQLDEVISTENVRLNTETDSTPMTPSHVVQKPAANRSQSNSHQKLDQVPYNFYRRNRPQTTTQYGSQKTAFSPL
jgi:hypothetical protein